MCFSLRPRHENGLPFRQPFMQPDAIQLDESASRLRRQMPDQPLLRCQTSRANIDARLVGDVAWILASEPSDIEHSDPKPDDINTKRHMNKVYGDRQTVRETFDQSPSLKYATLASSTKDVD